METGVRSLWRRTVLASGLVAFGVVAHAKVLVYDGFYYDPHDSTAYTTATVNGSPRAHVIGFEGYGWSGSGIIHLNTASSLEFPTDFDEAGFVPIGGSQQFDAGSSKTDGRGVQRNTAIFYTTWQKLGSDGELGPSLYMRTLMKIDAKAMSTLGDGNYYGIGLSRSNPNTGAAGSRYLTDTGCWLAFKKVGEVVKLVAKVGANDFALIDSVVADTTYIAIARIDAGAAQGGNSDAVSAYAAAIGDYDPAFDFVSTGCDVVITRGDSLQTSGSPRFIYMGIAGQYGPNGGKVWFDEFAVGTEVKDVVLKRIKGAPRVKDRTVLWDGDASFTAAGTIADNAADAVSLLTRNDAGEVVNVQSVTTTGGVDADVQKTADVQSVEATYSLAFVSVNAVASVTDEVSTVYFAQPVVAKVSDGLFTGEEPAVLTVSRATAENLPLEINYEFTSDEAEAGVHYVEPSGKVTIPVGERTATVELKPINGAAATRDVTLSFKLKAGGYYGGTAPVAVKICTVVIPEEYNVWLAAKGQSDGLASTAANWSKGVPTEDQDILVDGDWGTSDITWDAGVNGLPAKVANWEQRATYTGTVTFPTKFPSAPDAAFTAFTVTGNVQLDGGTWTCPVSFEEVDPAEQVTLEGLRAGRVYRLSVRAGAMTIDAGGAINVTGKGHARALQDLKSLKSTISSHGGTSPDSTLGAFGDYTAPEDIAPAAVFGGLYAPGGGALRLEVGGALVVNGAVRADGGVSPFVANDTPRVAAAGGSVWITARAVSGAGAITADAGDNGSAQNSRIGTGGRIAVIATDTVAADTLLMSAGYARSWRGGASGTVYWKDGTMTHGKLGLLNRRVSASDEFIFGPGCVTPMTGDWTVDGIEVFGPALLAVGDGHTLTLPNGFASVGSTDSKARGGLLVTDGAVSAGSGPQTLQGAWIFAATNFTFNGDVTVTDRATLGLPILYQSAAPKTVPTDFIAFRCTVNGNLDIQSTGFLRADRCGLCYSGGENLPDGIAVHGHGGRDAGSVAYDSYIDPRLPGVDSYSGAFGTTVNDARLSGGLILLTVTGTFNMDGKSSVQPTSMGTVNGCGAINVRAGRLTGKGSLSASANGSHTPGIVAVRLTEPGATFADFTGSITANRAGGSNGLVYRQTAADGEGGGTLTVNGSNTTIPIQLPAAGYGSDGKTGLAQTKVAFVNGGKAAATLHKQKLGEVTLPSGCTLDLSGKTVKVQRQATFGDMTVKSGIFTEVTRPDFLSGDGQLVIGVTGLKLFIR